MRAAAKFGSILVQRYASSRFYDTTNRCYVWVELLRKWARKGVRVSIIDAQNGEDITRIALA